MNKKGNQRYAETKEKIETIFSELLKKKDISEITVSEICRLAGIHRTTFYGHYEDIYDLMAKMIADFYVKMMDNFLPVDEIDGATWGSAPSSELGGYPVRRTRMPSGEDRSESPMKSLRDGATPGDNAGDEGTARTEERESGLRLGNGFSQLFTLVRENKTLLLAYMAECEKKGIAFDVLPDLLDEHIMDVMRKMNYSSKEEVYYHQIFFSAGLKAMLKAWLLRGCVESPEDMSQILADEYAPDKGRLFTLTSGAL
ncbi:MAG: TetR/AcrR family transcriptional regulator [Lachnospiraceae bacterium]|nr:TetR/AcrR family transcriptional regulator [Lachnospiraceae bacterium]